MLSYLSTPEVQTVKAKYRLKYVESVTPWEITFINGLYDVPGAILNVEYNIINLD